MKNNLIVVIFGILLSQCLTIFQLQSQVPKNISIVSTYSFPGQTLAACWHYEDSLGHDYALVGGAHGIAILSLDTPSNPRLLFQLPGITNLWHEVKVQGNYAYATSEGNDSSGVLNGMQIINLSYLPDSAPYVFYKGDGQILGQLTRAHSVTTAGHYVYINGHNISALGTGVLICDITNPMSPQYVGAITLNYCHDSYVRGDTIWTSDIRVGQFSVYDISDRTNPILRATQETPLTRNHNTWLSDDSRTIFTTDEVHGAPLASFDVSDLGNITPLDKYYPLNLSTYEVHNVRVLHDFLLCADYGSQVTIVDAHRPDNLIEIGNYHTGNSLCWDVDPFLSSGLLLATDMNSGIFYVLQPNYIRACYLEGHVTDSITGFSLNGVTVQILTDSMLKVTNPSGNYKTGIADSGLYSVRFSKTGYNTKIISAITLSSGTVTILNTELVSTGIGIAENELAGNIFLAPNPADQEIRIFSPKLEIKQISLFDPLGNFIQNISNNLNIQNQIEFPLEKLSSGMYFLKINTNKGIAIKKIIRY